MAEDLLVLREKADIVFWPIAMDAKYKDVDALQDGDLTVTLINGAIRNTDQASFVKQLRKKSNIIIAHGACAHTGGVVGLANFFSCVDLLNRAYRDLPTLAAPPQYPKACSKKDGIRLELPKLSQRVAPLNRVIPIDYYLPGCPPPPQLVKTALETVLSNDRPKTGTVFGDTKAMCHTCSRISSKPDTIKLTEFRRYHQFEWDADTCFLTQGLVCFGPATRGGCAARCIEANMPCRGCFGPLDHGNDQGLQSLSMLAALIDEIDEKKIDQIIHTLPDLAGLLYRYNLAASEFTGRLEGKE